MTQLTAALMFWALALFLDTLCPGVEKQAKEPKCSDCQHALLLDSSSELEAARGVARDSNKSCVVRDQMA